MLPYSLFQHHKTTYAFWVYYLLLHRNSKLMHQFSPEDNIASVLPTVSYITQGKIRILYCKRPFRSSLAMVQ